LLSTTYKYIFFILNYPDHWPALFLPVIGTAGVPNPAKFADRQGRPAVYAREISSGRGGEDPA
jgi:hypothetical protein